MTTEYLEAWRILAGLGGSTVIALAIVYAIYKIFFRFGTAFIEAGQSFVAAHQQIAQSMGAQAESMARMRDGLDRMIAKDNSEHREILLGVQVMGDELKSLVCEIREMREEHE